jgi:hypothetical protein
MKRKRTKKEQQGCDVVKVIHTVEQAAAMARKVYRVIEPLAKAIRARGQESQMTILGLNL